MSARAVHGRVRGGEDGHDEEDRHNQGYQPVIVIGRLITQTNESNFSKISRKKQTNNNKKRDKKKRASHRRHSRIGSPAWRIACRQIVMQHDDEQM
jgi:hypothetical protein